MNENALIRIEQKLDAIIERQSEHSSSLAVHDVLHKKNSEDLERNTVDMKKHIKRTDLLQKQMELALLPIKVLKAFVAIASGAGIIYSFIKLFQGS